MLEVKKHPLYSTMVEWLCDNTSASYEHFLAELDAQAGGYDMPYGYKADMIGRLWWLYGKR